MKLDSLIKKAHKLARPYCITDGAKFRLKDIDPGDTAGLTSEAKPRAKEALQMGVEALAGLQDMLYAQDQYVKAYEDLIRRTATVDAPWYVVPADNKWFTRIVVAAAVIDALASLDLGYPNLSAEKLKELAEAKEALLAEK
jgi:Polyphosphate kinase 2 (PPK2)